LAATRISEIKTTPERAGGTTLSLVRYFRRCVDCGIR
jgi:hypothetical protein